LGVVKELWGKAVLGAILKDIFRCERASTTLKTTESVLGQHKQLRVQVLIILRYNFIKEKLLGNEICTVSVKSADHFADMTKGLSKTRFENIC
jgi:hypothetical protein